MDRRLLVAGNVRDCRACIASRSTSGQDQGGFGLIEVMISMLLVMFAAAAGVAVLGATIHATSFANGIQAASRLGQDVVDRAMAEPFASLTGTSSDPVCRTPVDLAPITVSPQGGSPGNFTTYTRNCHVTNLLSDSSGVSFKAIRVVVTWVDGRDGRTHAVILGSQRAR